MSQNSREGRTHGSHENWNQDLGNQNPQVIFSICPRPHGLLFLLPVHRDIWECDGFGGHHGAI